jgi:replicative DNA helicase
MTQRLEETILRNLIQNNEYARKALPFLKDEYFKNTDDRLLFQEVREFIIKYNDLPTVDALRIEVENLRGITDDIVKSISGMLNDFSKDDTRTNIDWLLNSTEEFCQEAAIYNSITQALEIMNGSSKSTMTKGAIPQLLSDALAVSFNPSVGHDYLEETGERYEYYHRVEERLPFDLDFLNKISRGGVPKKTLNVIMGGVGAGKSLVLCHFASSYLAQGKNVLYITMELAEEEVAKRIDANLFNITLDDLMDLPKSLYEEKVSKLKSKTDGKLIIKEYPTASASVIHFRSLLNELNLKKNFVPDVVLVDYLNICASARIKPGNNVNSYTFVKAIAEELRGLAVEFNVPLWSATQLTRSGYGSSDPGMEDTSESFGLPATADLFIVIISTEQLEQMKQLMFKQLKNRYNDPSLNKRFVIGVDKSKMKLFDVEIEAQDDITDSGQDVPVKFKGKSTKDKFKNLKVV